MSELVEGRRRPNNTLDEAIAKACELEGMGWFRSFRVKLALRRLSASEHADLEKYCTGLLVESGVPLPASSSVEDGLLVGDWTSFLQMLLDRLPEILAFIEKLLPLFLLFV